MRLSLTPTHAVLALLVGAALVLLVGVALFTGAEQERAHALEGAEVAAAASGLAAALEPGADTEAILDEVVRRENLVGALLIDALGRVRRQSAGRRLDGIDWNAALVPASQESTGDQLVRRSWQGEVYWMASSPTVDGRRVVLLRSVTPGGVAVPWILGVAALLWVLVAVVAYLVLRVSERPAALLEEVARDLVRSEDATGIELVQKRSETRPLLGDRAKPLFDLASDLVATRRRATDAQTLANAFLQVGPHYALLCTLDGKVIDANPAFFARTSMMPEWLRGQPLDVLEETLPMKPIMELARRSRDENAAISGVPYALNVEGKRRAVNVALRTFPTAEGDTVLIVLSDLTKERRLEHQIDRYTDALDLMVDQRVAELTAGVDDLEPLLDAAGIAVITFDRAGTTKRFNATAERLTGRTAFTLSRFDQFAHNAFPDPVDREAFTAWFNGSAVVPLELALGQRAMLWLRGEQRQAGETTQRILVGIGRPAGSGRGSADRTSPAFVASAVIDAQSALDPSGAAGGDGYAYRHDESSVD